MALHEKPWYAPSLYAYLKSDCPRLTGIRPSEFERDCKTISSRLANEGESFLSKTLPSLGKVFDLALQKRCPLTHRSFRKEGPSVARPAFLQALLRRIFDDAGWVLESPDVLAIKLVRQVLLWFKKIKREPSDESLAQAEVDFIEVDNCLPDTDSKVNTPAVCVARVLVEHLLDSCPVPALPRHGPGAVASGDGVVGKRALNTAYRQLESVFRPIPWFFSLRDAAEDYTLITERQCYDSGVSRTEFVPKDSSGPRTIGLEPAEYMWCQQAVKSVMYSHIEKHGLTRGHVNFTDQTINRNLTAEWRDRDTLDMSKASDRVSYALVKALFGKTKLWPYLHASRTPRTRLPSGRLLLFKKFAPMGSAVCFPVESLVFWALTCSILHLYGGIPLNLVHRLVYVYGDDVIVPHGFAKLLREKYAEHAIVLNEDKSCIGGKFRESCGLDCFDGLDVSPVRMKQVDVANNDPLAVISLVKHGNRLYESEYRSAARVYRRCAFIAFYKTRLRRVPCYSDPHLPILYWRDDLSNPAKRSFCKEDQIWRVRGLILLPLKTKGDAAGEMRYYRESLVSGGPVGFLSKWEFAKARVRTFDVKYRGNLKLRTVPFTTCMSDGHTWDDNLLKKRYSRP